MKDKELIQILRDILRKNLTSEAGSAILKQMGRSQSNLEEKMVTVSVYNKSEGSDDTWSLLDKPVDEFQFAAHEYELAFETMKAYDSDEYDVSITFGEISADAMNGVQISPFFEFISSQAPVDNVLSGTKCEYVGEA